MDKKNIKVSSVPQNGTKNCKFVLFPEKSKTLQIPNSNEWTYNIIFLAVLIKKKLFYKKVFRKPSKSPFPINHTKKNQSNSLITFQQLPQLETILFQMIDFFMSQTFEQNDLSRFGSN